jgi:hypothetical protein
MDTFYDVVLMDPDGFICDELDGNFSNLDDAKLSQELEMRKMKAYDDYTGCSVAIREFHVKVIDKKAF